MPPIRRDISVMVPAETDDEAIGDQIRVALGPDADAVEAVEIRGADGLRRAAEGCPRSDGLDLAEN